jgi:hypothetical protein
MLCVEIGKLSTPPFRSGGFIVVAVVVVVVVFVVESASDADRKAAA